MVIMTKNDFKPAWWLPGPHLQTLWPSLCRRSVLKGQEIKRERLELPDGDFVDLASLGSEGPIVLILHGLEGSVHSTYAQGMLASFLAQGWQGILMHFRGCSGEPNRLSRCYHSGDTSDLAKVVQFLRQRHAKLPIAAVGFSLGANVLLKWLGETGSSNLLAAAVAISVPFELAKTSQRVQKGFSRVYQWHLLRSLRRRLQQKFERYPLEREMPPLASLKTLWDFDEYFTAPLHGFSSAHDYYTRCSSRQYLKDIRIPTLIIQAKDDPFMSMDLIPRPEELAALVKLELCPKGGHVGFVAGPHPFRAEYWLEKRVPSYLENYLSFK